MAMMVMIVVMVVVVEADWCRGHLRISPQLSQSLRRLISAGVV